MRACGCYIPQNEKKKGIELRKSFPSVNEKLACLIFRDAAERLFFETPEEPASWREMVCALDARYDGPAYKEYIHHQTYAVTIDDFAADRRHKPRGLQKLARRIDKLFYQYLEDFQADGDKPDELQWHISY